MPTEKTEVNAKISWHSLDSKDALEKLEVTEEGLKSTSVEERLLRDGPNKLPEAAQKHWVFKLLHHYNNVLIYVLLGAAVITALLDHLTDTWIILAVVVINGLIGFIQEGKAEKALDAVRGMLSQTAVVKRDHEKREIDSEKLVQGDIVFLKSGDKVPADIRILQSRELMVNEASLTGESEAVAKTNESVKPESALGDRTSMVYSGTIVVSGQGSGVVVGTGQSTEIGKINRMLSEVESLQTPLLRQVDQFGKRLTMIILAVGAVTFALGYFVMGIELSELFLSVVGLAVAAIPEGLPAVMTITLAIGVQKMAARNAIIRKLPGVETLGSVSVICSDKTGTLTRSEMTVTRVATINETIKVSGVGIAPDGGLVDTDTNPNNDQALHKTLVNCVRCNDARLFQEKDEWKLEGAPTEGALLSFAAKCGFKAEQLNQKYKRVDLIPFESEHKFMATLEETEGEKFVFIKGAPERIFERCESQLSKDGTESFEPDKWKQIADQLASEGHRLLALGYKKVDNDTQSIDFDSTRTGFIITALLGLLDPPREEAISSVAECLDAGIRVKMITGDHALTAAAIARQIGFKNTDKVVTGPELDATSDEDLVDFADEVDVFARVSPEHKLRLVEALQTKGFITAMTGDGVNDAPALKRADIGIAMGIKGTEASKEAAVMVLADDNFASITNAVEEGRTVYDNLKKSLMFMLPTNGGESLTIIAAILFGLTMPVTPAQILWINMVTAVTLALALAFEPMEKDVMARPPRKTDDSLTPPALMFRIGFVSVLLTATTLGIFAWAVKNELPIELARTLAVNMLVFGEVVYLFNSRYITASSLSAAGLKATKWVWLAVLAVIVMQIGYTYVPFMNSLFEAVAIKPVHWLVIIAINIVLFIIIEAEKAIQRKMTQ